MGRFVEPPLPSARPRYVCRGVIVIGCLLGLSTILMPLLLLVRVGIAHDSLASLPNVELWKPNRDERFCNGGLQVFTLCINGNDRRDVIFEHAKWFPFLQALGIDNALITEDSVKSMRPALKRSRWVHLYQCDVPFSLFENLETSRLDDLACRRMKLSPEIVRAICRCRQLEYLNLARCRNLRGAGKFIAENHRLNSLVLSYTDLEEEDLVQICGKTQAYSLELRGIQLPPKVLNALMSNSCVNSIFLSRGCLAESNLQLLEASGKKVYLYEEGSKPASTTSPH